MKQVVTLMLALFLSVSTAFAQTPSTTWTGGANSSLWANDANWSNNAPNDFTEAVIGVPIIGTSYPEVSTFGRSCLALTINAGATLTVNANVDLTIYGPLANNGTLLNNGIIKLTGNLTNNGTITSGGSSLLEFIDDGSGLPVTIGIDGSGTTTLNDVTFSNTGTTAFTTTNQVKINRVATVRGFNVAADGHVRLTSNYATTTGMVVNAGAGKLTGSVSVERSIDPSYNGTAGYRHFSTPVASPSVNSMTTAGYTPIVGNYVYPTNTSLTPFPNIYYYDESLVPTTVPTRTCTPVAGCTYPTCVFKAFEYGWRSPATLASPLLTTRGYTVQISATAKVVLEGVPNTGNYSSPLLGRGGNAESGWHLVGNPYPSPIDAYTVMANNLYNASTNPNGFDATVYFFRSDAATPATACGPANITNGTYQFINTATAQTGYYDKNGQPVTNSLLTRYFPAMQGFFVRKVTGTTPKAFLFKNTQRLTTAVPASGTITPFYRSAGTASTSGVAPAAPTLHVRLTDEFTNLRDHAQVSFRADAEAGHDARYDAVRPGDNVGNPTLFTVNADNEPCALNTLPALTGSTLVPLGLHSLEAGHRYTIDLAQNDLTPGTRVYLLDQETGKSRELTAQAGFFFTAQAGTYDHRFALRLEAGAGAAQAAPTEGLLVTYPNPGQAGSPLEFKSAAVQGSTATATLLNTFGLTVATLEVPVRDGQLAGNLPTAGLLPGIYILRLNAADKVTTQRIQIR